HEVRPLRKGYRLCLVYNLTLAKAKKPPAAPRTAEHVARVSRPLRAWAQEDAPQKLAFLLEHRYTQDGLAWDALKGVDRARARGRLAGGGEAGCEACLALVTLWESGSAVDDGGGYGHGYGGGWYDDYEEDEEEEDGEEEGDGEEGEEDNAGEYEMEEVFDSSLTASHLRDPEGEGLPVGELPVSEDELLDPRALRAVKPEEDAEGYKGERGMTPHRWDRT